MVAATQQLLQDHQDRGRHSGTAPNRQMVTPVDTTAASTPANTAPAELPQRAGAVGQTFASARVKFVAAEVEVRNLLDTDNIKTAVEVQALGGINDVACMLTKEMTTALT
ncbi:hypothetical protein PHYPSEUDO_005505 [Phytophthora pseudosyringae]|uniref:Uncharacterized protein n=1 Tax=Phytophthora pseudosyringae TaxID=221518 RepID=A0A8T1VNY9_9STRA|nr:hypothetical protein PHYPSEUDO_005505 [Phytophthora pseudosyringae]